MQAECYDPITGAMQIKTRHLKLLFCMLQSIPYEAEEVKMVDENCVILSERLYHEVLRYQSGVPTPAPTGIPSTDLRRQTGKKRGRDIAVQTDGISKCRSLGVQTDEVTGVVHERRRIDDDDILETVYLRSHDTLPAAVVNLDFAKQQKPTTEPPVSPINAVPLVPLASEVPLAPLPFGQEQGGSERGEEEGGSNRYRHFPPAPPSSIMSGTSRMEDINQLRGRLLGVVSHVGGSVLGN